MDKTFSHTALAHFVKKLELKPGNVLIVSNIEVLKQLQRMPALGFDVPVLFSPEGKGIEVATREQLLEALMRIDEAVALSEGMT